MVDTAPGVRRIRGRKGGESSERRSVQSEPRDLRAMRQKSARKTGKGREIVLLADLVPRKDPTGGFGKLLFGEQLQPVTQAQTPLADRPELPARKSAAARRTKVKGGKVRGQDLS